MDGSDNSIYSLVFLLDDYQFAHDRDISGSGLTGTLPKELSKMVGLTILCDSHLAAPPRRLRVPAVRYMSTAVVFKHREIR
jgi:hypothetical protein